MGIKTRLLGGGYEPPEPDVVEVSEELAEDLHTRAGDLGSVITIVPYKRDGGMPLNRAFFKSVHSIRRNAKRENVAEPFTFELVYWKRERRIGFRYACQSAKQRRAIRRAAESCYEHADIHEEREMLIDVEAGDALTAGHLAYRADDPGDELMPINNYKLNPEDFKINPYDPISSEMTGDDHGADASVVVQVVCKPAVSLSDREEENWHHGSGDKAEELADPEHGFRFWGAMADFFYQLVDPEHEVEVEQEGYQSSEDTSAADVIANQRKTLGYHVNIRVMCVGDGGQTTRERLTHVCEKYRNFYNATHGQGLKPVYEEDSVETARRVASREWVDRAMPMCLEGLAGLGGPPMDLNTGAVEYTYTQNDEGQPPGIETFGAYDETGITDELAAHQNTQNTTASELNDDGRTLSERLDSALGGDGE